jgi:hypothetical protein
VRLLLYSLAVVVLTPALAYGSWLVITPDYDGGRRPVGAMVLTVVAVVVLLAYIVRRAVRRRAMPR